MTTVPENALLDCIYVKEVILSSSTKTVSDGAFKNCTSLKTVVFSDSLNQINYEAFSGCTSLKTINLPDSITSIGEDAFRNCSVLTGVELPEDLTFIGNRAFAGCTKIDSIILPEQLKTISNQVFAGTAISDIIIPASVETMYTYIYNPVGFNYYNSALYGMENLTKVTFADGMTTVPENALLDCAYIEEVVIYDCNESLETMKTTATEKDFKLTVLPCSGCHHRITEIRNTIEATCSANGYTGDTCCKDCGIIIEKGTETEKTAHTEVPVKGFDSDCAKTGLTDGTKCSICNAVIKSQDEIPVKEHTFGNWTLVKNPTITEEGMEERKCSVCDETETRAVAKIEYLIGDVNGDGKITAADARIVLRVSAKLEKFENYNRPFEVFDIISDGKITAADARKILRISAKLE